MNYEKQVCKQTQEQPAYIKDECLLRMQRASLCRYERSTNVLQLMPLFFEFSEKIEKIVDSVMKKYAEIQQASLFCNSDAEVSALISGMVRSIKALPLVVKQETKTQLNSRPSILTARTTYDLVYYYFAEKMQEEPFPEQFLKAIIAELGQTENWGVEKYCYGAVIIDKTVDKETILQNACQQYEIPPAPETIPPLEMLETPGAHTIEDLANFTKKPTTELVKAVMYEVEGKLVFVNIRGDLECSEEKLRHYLGLVDSPVEINLASPELLEKHGLVPGFAGLVGMKRAGEAIVICDESVKTVHAGVTGANKQDYHYFNFNLPRDTKKIAKNIRYADVAASPNTVKGAIIAEVAHCTGFPAEVLGNDSKPTKTPLYKITFRLIDAVAVLLGKMKIDGAYVMNLLKNDSKIDLAVPELLKIYKPCCVVVDNRPKANFGVKNDTAKMSLLSHVIVLSNKTDDQSVMVDEVPVKVTDLVSHLSH